MNILISFFLSLALVVQSVALLHLSFANTAIGTFLFMGLNLNEDLARSIDIGGAVLVVLLAAQMGVSLFNKERDKFLTYLAYFIAFWMALLALTTFLNGGSFGARFAPFAYFARIGLPLALVAFYSQKSQTVLLLKIVISITFITHGIEALTGHPGFIDYVFLGMKTLFGFSLTEPQSINFLRAVGIMDIVCGILLVFTQSKKLALWMAFWGFLTASMRIFGFGVQNWAELAIRVSHFALPLALYYHWRQSSIGEITNANDQRLKQVS